MNVGGQRGSLDIVDKTTCCLSLASRSGGRAGLSASGAMDRDVGAGKGSRAMVDTGRVAHSVVDAVPLTTGVEKEERKKKKGSGHG